MCLLNSGPAAQNGASISCAAGGSGIRRHRTLGCTIALSAADGAPINALTAATGAQPFQGPRVARLMSTPTEGRGDRYGAAARRRAQCRPCCRAHGRPLTILKGPWARSRTSGGGEQPTTPCNVAATKKPAMKRSGEAIPSLASWCGSRPDAVGVIDRTVRSRRFGRCDLRGSVVAGEIPGT